MTAKVDFAIRQNTCPHCGYYDWAHPIEGICLLTANEAKLQYLAQAAINRLSITKPRPA
jgi:hypothetical protein